MKCELKLGRSDLHPVKKLPRDIGVCDGRCKKQHGQGGPSRAPLPALHLIAQDSDRNQPSGMRGLSSPPPGCTLHSFGTSTDPWPKQLTTSSSFLTRPSKRLPSVTLPSWGPCPASAFSYALASLASLWPAKTSCCILSAQAALSFARLLFQISC